ncbi:MAG: ATP-grasp domain-containing protein [ANME-2 cluster archaeon]|nr:MAG: ATP-grasp domain-containing protein [ANME-2 cluster archaeon]
MGDQMYKDKINIIVTAVGAPGAPGIIKSLRMNGERILNIIGTDMNPESVGLSMVDKFYVVPPGTSPEFIPAMLEIAEKEGVDVILPLATYELMSFSENKAKFENIGVTVLVSDPVPLEIANNKGKLYEFLEKKGILVPKYKKVDNFHQFEKYVYELGYPNVPVCIKPQVSKGSRGFRILNDNIDKLDLLMNHKPDTSITTLEEMQLTLKNANPFPKMVVMEYLPGKEYSVDVLVRKGEALITVSRLRDVIKLGISFVGIVENNIELEEIANKIVKEIGLDYNINLQFKYSISEVPKIIEINPRVSGTIILCTGAGVNLPYLAVKMALGEEIPSIKPEYGTKMIRYWEEVFIKNNGRSYQLK